MLSFPNRFFTFMLIASLSLLSFVIFPLFCCHCHFLPTILPSLSPSISFISSLSSLPLLTPSLEEGVRSSGSCGGVVLSCTDKLNRRTVLVRPVSKQESFSHFSGFFPPVRIQCFPFEALLNDSA